MMYKDGNSYVGGNNWYSGWFGTPRRGDRPGDWFQPDASQQRAAPKHGRRQNADDERYEFLGYTNGYIPSVATMPARGYGRCKPEEQARPDFFNNGRRSFDNGENFDDWMAGMKQSMNASTDEVNSFLMHDRKIENSRQKYFKRWKNTTYLDFAGATPYNELHLETYQRDLSENLYGNPHSQSTSSKNSSHIVNIVRDMVLRHFNTTRDNYTVIFTKNCSAALHLVADCFEFNPQRAEKITDEASQPVYAYLEDNHTSVLGVREVVATRGVSFQCISAPEVESELNKNSDSKVQTATRHIFAFPAQSNFSGERYPLRWIDSVQRRSSFCGREGRWYVLLDAASYLTSSALDLGKASPDFVSMSFYKILGFPTGLGALLVKNTSGDTLQKTYFGGGTIDVALAAERFHISRSDLSERFEDGTLPFLEILALKHGFDAMSQFAGPSSAITDHCFRLASWLYWKLSSLRHSNGSPLAILYHTTGFTSPLVQGPIVTFNVLKPDGSYVGFAQVEKLADMNSIHVRSGCFCNMGAGARHLKMTTPQIKNIIELGHICGDDMDVIDGQPIGAIRASLGYTTTMRDVRRFVKFIEENYVDRQTTGMTFRTSNNATVILKAANIVETAMKRS